MKEIVTFGLALAICVCCNEACATNRSFTVDYNENTFRKDGKPFRYVAGSFHYFRALPETWKTKLRTMRAAGLNAVDTYVEWSLHNPKDGIYDFEGIANVVQFIKYAVEEDLYVILRPGPYICAERDNGGLPYWLFRKYPNIQLRTSDPNYLKEVELWYSKLMPIIQPYLYGNGGPIIMVQVENEYGVFSACDSNYLTWLANETRKYVQEKAVLFTTDIPDEKISCGKIDGVFATIDFGIDRAHEMKNLWSTLRSVQPNGPLVNSEFYPGWLTHWQEPNQRRDADKVAEALRQMLEDSANVNFYMFFGGTNFGYTAGANDWGIGTYTPDITSYDYDAVMDEAGDPTPKYFKIRDVIKDFLPLPSIPVPSKAPKMSLDPVQLKILTGSFLSDQNRQYLIHNQIEGLKPSTFEELDLDTGFVGYETQLPKFEIDPTLLTVNDLRDRALVLVDNTLIGTLSRENCIKSLPINAGLGNKLLIIVENQGRINFNTANDTKGILGNVTIQQRHGTAQELTNWKSIALPMTAVHLKNVIGANQNNALDVNDVELRPGPNIFFGDFNITRDEIYDTFLDMTGWVKGVVIINDLNLGRYWPVAGPQITLYVPKECLKKGNNRIIIFELEKGAENGVVEFTDTPKLDG